MKILFSQTSVCAMVLVLFSIGFGQETDITLVPNHPLKFASITPEVPTATSTFVVSGSGSITILVTSEASGISVSVECPNGQTLTPNNIGTVGGVYETYTIEPENPWSVLISELSFGTHYNFQFPAQGAGTYTIRYQAPAGLTEGKLVMSELRSDSTLTGKLFSTRPRTRLGKPVVLSVALFDGSAPVTGATVIVHVKKPSGARFDVALVDDGNLADDAPGDGLYSGSFVADVVGMHSAIADMSGVQSPSGSTYAIQSSTEFFVDPVIASLTGSVSNYGVDTNADGLFENLTIQAETDIFVAGSYGINVRLKTTTGQYMIAASEDPLVLATGANSVRVSFSADEILSKGENGPFLIESIDLVSYTSEGVATIVDSLFDVGSTDPYQLSQFQRPPILFVGQPNWVAIDVNQNGKYEVLTVELGINVLSSGNYQITGDLFDQNGNLIALNNRSVDLVAGSNILVFSFSGRSIVERGIPGPYRLDGVAIYGNGTSAIYTNKSQSDPYQLVQFESTDIAFSTERTATGVDMNANGRFETLRIQSQLYAARPGNYSLSATLKAPGGTVVGQVSPQLSLATGMNVVQFNFDGAPIANAGLDGPLYVTDVIVSGPDAYLSVPAFLTTQLFNSNQFEIGLEFTGQNNTAQGIDSNSNGNYEALRVGTELYAFLPGYYSISISLIAPGGATIQTINRTQFLNAGTNQLQFDFSGTFIRNANVSGPLTVGNVSVSGLGRSLQVPVLFTTSPFDSSQFEAVFEFAGGYSATGVDTNSDGKFNLLRVQGNMNVLIAGSYIVVVRLQDVNGNTITESGLIFNFTAGVNTFTFNLRGNDIHRSGVNGPYRVWAQAWDYPAQVTTIGVNNLFETGPFSYTDFERTFGFTGVNSAAGIDANANGKFDTLRISSGILIERPGAYTISASLKDNTGNVIQVRTIGLNLTVGTNTLNFDFEGLAINNNGVDGPYTVGNITVSGADTLTVSTLFTTQAFTTDQFESGIVDLHFASYRLVPTIGDGDIFLEPGETAELYIRLSNHNNGQARNSFSTLTTASSAIEILTNGSFGTIQPGAEKESTAFVVRLRPEAAYGVVVPFSLNVGYNSSEAVTVTFSAQTGKLNKILYNQNIQNRRQIFSMNSDGSGKTNLSNSSFNDYAPVSAPNGSKIAYQRLVNGSELWLMNSDGSGQERVTNLHGFGDVDLSWSPDSTKIAFLTEIDNVVDLFVINADGSGLVRLTNTPGHEYLVTWSSTNKIAYATNWGEDIHVVNPDGSGDTLIHDNATNDLYIYDLSWSPDGSWIGWINERRVTQPTHYYTEVYIARPDGTEKRSLTTNAEAQRLVWSPDSGRIAYLNDEESGIPAKIVRIDVASGQTTDLSSFPNNTAVYQFRLQPYESPKWSPDGASIAFLAREDFWYPTFSTIYSVFLIDTMNGQVTKVAPGNNGSVYKPEWENLDRIPPASVISMTPPANANGWNTSDVSVGITATDNPNGTGVQGITYSASGAQTINSTTITGVSTLVNVFIEGMTSIGVSAKDNANNIEDIRSHVVKIDKSLPISQHTLNAGSEQTTVTLTATDSVSGVSEIVYSIDGGAPQTYATPFSVSNTGGHSVSYFARDMAGNAETPRAIHINAAQVSKSVLISEFRTRGYLGADDEFIELYNNSDTSIEIGGWSLSAKHGAVTTPIALATINSGAVIPARGHYLLRRAGSGNYSLGGYAEADQTYTDSLGDNCGIKLISNSSVTIDAVGFAAVTDSTYREGTGISPSAGITTNGQHSFARNFVKHLPVDSNNNKTDFAFVSTDGATYNNLKSILGSPGPENLASPVYREGEVLVTQIDTGVTLAEAPNRVFNYTNPPAQYPVGVLSVRRKLTNNSGAVISQLRLRITAITTKNSPIVFPQQALLRLFNSADITVTNANGQTTIPLRGLSVETVPTTGDGGLNSSFTLDLGPTGLSSGESVNIDLKSGIVTNGQYRLEFRIETVSAGP